MLPSGPAVKDRSSAPEQSSPSDGGLESAWRRGSKRYRGALTPPAWIVLRAAREGKKDKKKKESAAVRRGARLHQS
ncbi:hypothetical protein NDU88_000921 [Pleurodeles waltl]|uniref:Uncharacterized protein n=1 Tax=Pleurodeles waltl TaxID=8319 RepID=A0AAV7NCR8_PLEWA|nr:hypothetical protein NDU88_000921 [Pleurodeles waltl]